MSESPSDRPAEADAFAETRPPSDPAGAPSGPASPAEAVTERPAAAATTLPAQLGGEAPGLWTRLRRWTGRPERIRDAGVLLIFMALMTIPVLLAQGYSLLRFLSDPDAAPVRAGLLIDLAVLALGIALRLWVGFKMIARRPWAIWTAPGLQAVVIWCLIFNTWVSIRRAQESDHLGTGPETVNGSDTTAVYVRPMANLLSSMVPFLACCLAVHAYYRGRNSLRETPSPPRAWTAAGGALLLVLLLGGWDALHGGEKVRPDIDHLGGTRLMYEVDRESARTRPFQIEDMAGAMRQRLAATGARDAGARAMDDRHVEVSIPITGKNHEDLVHRIKEVLASDASGIGFEFRILANQHDDWPAINLARRYFERARQFDNSERKALMDAASAGRPPPPPEDNGSPFIGTATIVAAFSYQWVKLGRSEQLTMGLDDASEGRYVDDPAAPGGKRLVPVTEFRMDGNHLYMLDQPENREQARERQHQLFWHEAAVARGEEKRIEERGEVLQDGKEIEVPLVKFVKTTGEAWRKLLAEVRDKYKLPGNTDFKIPEGKVDDLAKRVRELVQEQQNRDEPIKWIRQFIADRHEAERFQTLSVPSMAGALLYSRRVPKEDPAERVEYFLLTRDPQKGKEVTGLYLEYAQRGQDEQGRLAVSFRFNQEGGDRLYDLTSQNAPIRETNFHRFLAVVLDNKIVSAPSLNAKIRNDGIIQGDFTVEEIDRYVMLLNAKPLPAPLAPDPSEETTVRPTLGKKLLWALGPPN